MILQNVAEKNKKQIKIGNINGRNKKLTKLLTKYSY